MKFPIQQAQQQSLSSFHVENICVALYRDSLYSYQVIVFKNQIFTLCQKVNLAFLCIPSKTTTKTTESFRLVNLSLKIVIKMRLWFRVH